MEIFWLQAQPVFLPAVSGSGPPLFALPRFPAAPRRRPTWFLLRSKVFSWLYCHIALKTAQIAMANRLAQAGIPLTYAISVDKGVRCSCCDRGLLPSVSGDRRLCSFIAQRFCPKSIANTDADCFPDTGI